MGRNASKVSAVRPDPVRARVMEEVRLQMAGAAGPSVDRTREDESVIVRDARQVLDGRDDLAEFARRESEVNADHFDRLEKMLEIFDDGDANAAILENPSKPQIQRRTRPVFAVQDALSALLARAELKGVPRNVLLAQPVHDEPAQLLTDAEATLVAFDLWRAWLENDRVVMNLAEELRATLPPLRAVVKELAEVRSKRAMLGRQRVAVKVLMRRLTLHIARFGREMAGGDEAVVRTYRLRG